jgi:uncharacterized repeat protein (TIGR01451 family)
MRRMALVILVVLAGFLAQATQAQTPNTINTIAGGGTNSGAATSAVLPRPFSVVRDTLGNTFISSPSLDIVYKVTGGTITAYAGTGIAGFSGDGGAASAATVDFPSGLALDAAGNLFIADEFNNRIRRVDATSHVITTVAGSGDPFFGNFGGDGGPATNAFLNIPLAVAVDANENIFIADTGNNLIRRVDSVTQNITTIAGNGNSGVAGQPNGDGGPATSARLNQPSGLAVDSTGNVFIADWRDNVIRKVNTTGTISTYAGNGSIGSPGAANGDGGLATAAQIDQPRSVAVDPTGNVFLTDSGNPKIREVDLATLHIKTIAGAGTLCVDATTTCGDGGPALSALLNFPEGVSLDNAGDILIADTQNQRIRVVTAGTISNFAGGGPVGDGAVATKAVLGTPQTVAVDKTGNIYALETAGERLRRLDAKTNVITTYAGSGLGGGTLGTTNGDGGPATKAAFVEPVSVAIDAAGNLYVLDDSTFVIRKIDTSVPPVITTVVGNGQQCSARPACGDGGSATSASLASPGSIAVDSKGDLFVSERGLATVRRIDAKTGIISTFAGTPQSACQNSTDSCGDDGPATSAQLNFPIGLAFDAQDNLYIADAGDNRIRQVGTGGDINAFAFTGVSSFGGDLGGEEGGFAFNATMEFPEQVALDDKGNLYVGGGSNNVVRRIDASDQSVITVAGDIHNLNGGFSGDGGPSVGAMIANFGLVLDASHNLFIADSGSDRVRKVNLAPVTVENGTFTAFPPTVAGTINFESAQNITFQNNGLDDLILNVTSPVAPSAFQLGFGCVPSAPPCTITIPPQESTDIAITFAPPAGVAGTLTGTLTITTNDPANPSFTFPLSGSVAPPVTLNVSINPANSGSVSSEPAGIDCPTSCSATFATGAVVTLFSSPSTGFASAGWNTGNAPGANCPGVTETCNVTMNFSQSIIANFAASAPAGNGIIQVLNPNPGNGTGTVTSVPAGISCPPTCSFSFPANTPVTLTATATAANNSVFAGWLGAFCSSSGIGPCSTAAFGGSTTTVAPVFSGPAQAFVKGQVFLSTDDAMVFVFNPTGTVAQVLPSSALAGRGAGMTFDSVGNLYLTNPNAVSVQIFTNKGAGPATFATANSGLASPMSGFVDLSGNIFIGDSLGDGGNQPRLLQFTAGKGGAPANIFFPAYDLDMTPSHWVELLNDGQTVAYTLGGKTLMIFNLSDQDQHADLVINLHGAMALRVLADNTILVADTDRIVRVDTNGNITKTYTIPAVAAIFQNLNLDPDGATFWTTDQATGIVYRLNLASGAVVSSFPTSLGILSNSIFSSGAGGLAVFGQPQSGGADVSIAMTGAPDPVTVGAQLTYTMTVTNNGPLNAANVQVTDPLPAGVTFFSVTPAGPTCTTTSPITCNLGTLNAGAKSTITLIVTANTAGTVTNTATVSSSTADPDVLNNTATASTTVSGAANPPVLAIAKSHTGNFTQGQQNAAYSVVVSNGAAAGPTKGTVTMTETVPAGLTLVSMAGTGWTCVTTTCTRADVLAAGASYPAIAVTVNVAAAATSPQVNAVAVAGGGSVAANTTDSTIITTAAVPALAIVKSHVGSFAQGQQNATYSVSVSNGAAAAPTTGLVTVTETAPAGLTLVSMAGTGWTCAVSTCTRTDALAAGASYPTIAVTVNVAANATSPQINAVAVSGGGSAATNTTDSTIITTIAAPALAIVKSHVGNFAQGQQNAAYSVLVSNGAAAGPTKGTVTMSETVPAGLTLVSMAGTGWSCVTTTCTRADVLAAGASYPAIAVTVDVSATATSPQINAVAVSGGGSAAANTTDSTVITPVSVLTPSLQITKTHTGNFTQGQAGATYTVTVSNASGAAATSGTVTVTDTLPSGLTLVSLAGTGWTCAVTCTRADVLAAGASYPPITVTVNVGGSATSPQINSVSASGGGSATASTTDSTIISPITGATWATTGNMISPRAEHTATLLSSGQVLVTGGVNLATGPVLAIAGAELYNPTSGAFTSVGNMTTARAQHTATQLNGAAAPGNILIAGGFATTSVDTSATAELYNPTANTFTATTGSMTTARFGHTATLLPNGQVLIAGGRANNTGTGYLASAELFNPATGTFTATGNMTTARIYHSATLLANGQVLIAGGKADGATFLNTAELYDPATGKFTAIASTMSSAREAHTASTLSDGTVLLAGGGVSNSGTLSVTGSGDIYNPTANTFTPLAASMANPRAFHTASVLGNGTVLLAGGGSSSDPTVGLFEALSSSELYNPTAKTFSPAASLNFARGFFAATLLNTGSVLAEGGFNGNNSAFTINSSAELFGNGSVAVPVLNISKTHTGNFAQGQTAATYTVTVSNGAAAAPTSGLVTMTETVPAGLTLVSMAGTEWTCAATTCTRTDALAAGASYPAITVTVNVAGNATSPQVNAVSVSGGGSAAANATDSTVVTAAGVPALSITKTHAGNFTQGQKNATYTVTVSNGAAAGPTAGLVTVTETAPTGLSLVSMAGTGWTCAATTCTRTDTLAAGASYAAITVTVNVAANATSPQVNAVAVSGGGSATANTTDSTVITNTSAPALSITKTHTGSFNQGQQGATYTVTVSNAANAGPTTGTVTVTDTVPEGLTFVSATGTGWTCVANTCTRADALAAGASYPAITVTVNVAANATSPQVNAVAVSGGGSAAANTTDSTTITQGLVTITIPEGGSTTASTTPGGTAFYGLMLTGAPGVTGTVQLGCVPSSPLITCQVVPSSVTLNGGTTEVAFGISTFCQGATLAGANPPFNFGGKFGGPLFLLAFAGMLWTLQRNRRLAVAFAMIIMITLGSAACASLPKGPAGATPPGTYTLTLSTTINQTTQTYPNFLTLLVK